MSTIPETIYTLEEFNKWRRGNKTITAPDPFEVGVAIGDAVRLLRELFVMQVRAEKAESELAKRDAEYLRGAKMVAESASVWQSRAEKAEADLAKERARMDDLVADINDAFITLASAADDCDDYAMQNTVFKLEAVRDVLLQYIPNAAMKEASK
jgi:hypothetical protein